jgi:hypothetical protein
MTCTWKKNWAETRQHFIDWWNGDGFVLGTWLGPWMETPYEPCEDPGPAATPTARYTDIPWRVEHNHWCAAHTCFAADIVPMAKAEFGPGALSLVLGSRPDFARETVWFHPCYKAVETPEDIPPFVFDPDNEYWRLMAGLMRRMVDRADGRYFVSTPDLVENVDILASLRDTQTLLMDMVLRPDWVRHKVDEITQVWKAAFDGCYEIVKDEEGGNCTHFSIWGPGKTAKLQSDMAAMFSPDMFRRFVRDSLAEQCDYVDYSMFHLDGSECLDKLDILLGIESLTAIEWTTDPNVPDGGDPCWYEMYNRILAAGKRVQAINLRPDQVVPLFEATGAKGVYAMVEFENEAQIEALARDVEPFR